MKPSKKTFRKPFAGVLTTPFLLVLLATALCFAPPFTAPVAAQTTAKTWDPVPDSDGSAREINEFQAADQKQMPPKNAVLFMGSSSIRLWSTLAADFAEIAVINRGFGGSLIQDSTRFLDRIAVPYQPKIIVLFAGTNDLAYGGKNPAQVIADFREFSTKIHAALPDTRIVYLSINPTNARWKQEAEVREANYGIEKFIFETNSPTRKLNYINSHAQLLSADGKPQTELLQGDGLHLNSKGYEAWTAIIKPRVMALAALDGVERRDAPKPAP